MPSKNERIIKAIEARTKYLRRDDAKGDEAEVALHATKIIGFASRLVPDEPDEEVNTGEFGDYFEVLPDDPTPLMIGGSPGNPNGVSMTFGQAVLWWIDVFRHGYNISRTRPTLLPGSRVLSREGYDAAVKLGRESTNFTPEDYNPLGLEVIP